MTAAIGTLCAAKANLEAVNADGQSSLQQAAYIGHAAATQALLIAGADPTFCAANEDGATAVHFAAADEDGQCGALEVLLDAGVDLEVKDADGWVST